MALQWSQLLWYALRWTFNQLNDTKLNWTSNFSPDFTDFPISTAKMWNDCPTSLPSCILHQKAWKSTKQFPNGCFSLDTLLPQVPPIQHHCQLSKHKWESSLHNAQCSPHCWRHQNGVKETWLQVIAPEAECKEAGLEERQLQLSDIYSTFGTAGINSQNDLFNSGERMERVRFDGSFLNFSMSDTLRSSPPSSSSSPLFSPSPSNFFLSLSSSSSCKQLLS